MEGQKKEDPTALFLICSDDFSNGLCSHPLLKSRRVQNRHGSHCCETPLKILQTISLIQYYQTNLCSP